MTEHIVAAALQYDGLIISMPQPARHAHVLWALGDAGAKPNVVHGACQGFTTNTGRFVSRIEARNIAWIAGQIGPDKKSISETELFSEDLW